MIEKTNDQFIEIKNPGSGALLSKVKVTPLEEVRGIFLNARVAQASWALVSAKERSQIIKNASDYILDHLNEISELIHNENGKPVTEALVHDVLPVLELIQTYTKKAPKLLQDKKIPMRIMWNKKSYLNYWPVGVVAVISPWNFPFSIPFGEVIMGLLAGNAVILKPSEVTPLIALKIKEILDNAGLPKNIFQVVVGDGLRGSEIIKNKPDKIFFTGSVLTGKKIMSQAAENLTPVVLELGGKDPMIVLSDANIDFATSAALWGSFANSGQVCASTERVIVHESIHDEFVSLLKLKVEKLKNNPDGYENLGYITYEKQKKIYKDQLAEINSASAEIVTGGVFSNNETKLEPTIVINPKISAENSELPLEKLKIYREETFGPTVAITKFSSIEEAIEKANDSEYGLLSSIITRNVPLAEQIAKKIQAGSVLINDVIYTHALSETPWGGVKNSGFGRVHSDAAFYEFVNVRHIHKDKISALYFKPLWWFPYTKHQLNLFKYFMMFMYRKSILRRLMALPNMLVEFVEMLKKEKRL